MVAEARKVVEDATDWAEAQPDPDPATAQLHVYASTSRRRAWTIRCGSRRGSSATAARWGALKGGRLMAVMTLHRVRPRDAARRRCAATSRSSCWARTWARRAACSSPPTGCTTSSAATACSTRRCRESMIVGVSIGAAVNGLRPVPGDPVRRLHLPGLQPDPVRGGADALPLQRRVLGAR